MECFINQIMRYSEIIDGLHAYLSLLGCNLLLIYFLVLDYCCNLIIIFFFRSTILGRRPIIQHNGVMKIIYRYDFLLQKLVHLRE